MMAKSLLTALCYISTYSFGQNLYLNETSGSTSTYSISNINKITFQNGDVVIKMGSTIDNFPISGTRSITFQPFTTPIYEFNAVDQNLSAYPNPCADILNISDVTDNEKYFIHDLNGNLIQSATVFSIIDVSNVNSGIYILSLNIVNGVQTIKFVKQ